MIPKIIHIIVGPKSTPLIDRCINSWLALKDLDFEIRFWDDFKINEFISNHYTFALDAVLNARNHAEVADISRYAIVHFYGGYYVDWDIELLDVDKFLELDRNNPAGYLIQDPINQTLASEAFSAEIGEEFLFNLIDNIIDIYENNFRDSMATPQYSGPYRMRDVYYFTKKKSKQNLIAVKEVFLYDYSEIRQMPLRNVKTAMIHYWIHSWMKP